MGKRFFGLGRSDELDAGQQRQAQAAQGVQQVQAGFFITRAAQRSARSVEGHQQRTRRRQAFAGLEAGLEVFADLGHYLTQQCLRNAVNPRRISQQVKQVQRHTNFAQGDAGVLAGHRQPR